MSEESKKMLGSKEKKQVSTTILSYYSIADWQLQLSGVVQIDWSLDMYYVSLMSADNKRDRQNKCFVLWVRFLAFMFLQKVFQLGVLRLAAEGGAVYNWSGLDAHIFPP